MAIRTVFLQFTSNAGTISGQLGALTASVRSLTVAQREAELASGKQSQAFQKEQAAKESVRAANQRLQTAEQELLTARKLAVEVAQAGVQKSADEVAAHKLLQGALKDTATAQKGVDQSTQRLTTAVTQHETAARNAESAASKYGAAIEQNNQVHNRAVGSIGKVTALIGVGMVAGFAEATKAAVQWQQTMANVQAVTGVNDRQLQSLSQVFLTLSGQIPRSANDIAAAYVKISQEGFHGAQAIQVLTESSRLAIATNTDLATATSTVATVMNTWQLNLGQAAHAVDLFSVASRMANMPFDQFMQAVTTAAPVAREARISINEVSAAIAAMSQEGIAGAQASMGFQRFLLQAGKAGTDVSNALITVAHNAGALNVSTGSAALGVLGFSGALKGLLQLTNGNMDALEKYYPSIRAARPLFALVSNGAQNYQQVLAKLNDTTYVAIEAEKQYEAQRNTAAAQMTEFHNQWHALSISIGNTFIPVLKDAISALETIGHVIGDLVGNGAGKEILIWTGAAAAGFLALAGAAAAVTAPFRMLMETWTALRAVLAGKTLAETLDAAATNKEADADLKEATAARVKAAADRGAAGASDTKAVENVVQGGGGGPLRTILNKAKEVLGIGGGLAGGEAAAGAGEAALGATGAGLGAAAVGTGAVVALPLAIAGGYWGAHFMQSVERSRQNTAAIRRYTTAAAAEAQGPIGQGGVVAQAGHELGQHGLALEQMGLGGTDAQQRGANAAITGVLPKNAQTGWSSVVTQDIAAAGRPLGIASTAGIEAQTALYQQFTMQLGFTDSHLQSLGFTEKQIHRIDTDVQSGLQGNTKARQDLNAILHGSLGPTDDLTSAQKRSLDAYNQVTVQAARSSQGYADATKQMNAAHDARITLDTALMNGTASAAALNQAQDLSAVYKNLQQQFSSIFDPNAIAKDALTATQSIEPSAKDSSAVFSDAMKNVTKAAQDSAQDQATAWNNNLANQVKTAQGHVKQLQDQQRSIAAEAKAIGPGVTNDGQTALRTHVQAAQAEVTQLQEAQKANHKTAADFATDTSTLKVSFSDYVSSLHDAAHAEAARKQQLTTIRNNAMQMSSQGLLPMSTDDINTWVSDLSKLGPEADQVIAGMAQSTGKAFAQIATDSQSMQKSTQTNLNDWLQTFQDAAKSAGSLSQDYNAAAAAGLIGPGLKDQISKMAPDAADHILQQILFFFKQDPKGTKDKLAQTEAQLLLGGIDTKAIVGMFDAGIQGSVPDLVPSMAKAINAMITNSTIDQPTAQAMIDNLNAALKGMHATIAVTLDSTGVHTVDAASGNPTGGPTAGASVDASGARVSERTGYGRGGFVTSGAADVGSNVTHPGAPSGGHKSDPQAFGGVSSMDKLAGKPEPIVKHRPDFSISGGLQAVQFAKNPPKAFYDVNTGDPLGGLSNVAVFFEGDPNNPKHYWVPPGFAVAPMAQGGVERHNAQIASGATMRVWAEPETGGEAYIPLSPSKRHRSTNILHEVADDFGYHLTPHARGSVDVNPFASMFKPTHIRSIAAPEVRFASGGTTGNNATAVGSSALASAAQAAAVAAGNQQDVVSIITGVARSLGIDPRLAIAIAQRESGLVPNKPGDYYHGSPTSFGLYQLHVNGELGNLTPEQAYDPKTNASVALRVLADVLHRNPKMDPGAAAAAAQRPKFPVQYARDIDALMGQKMPTNIVFAGAPGSALTAPFPDWNPGTQGRRTDEGWDLQDKPGTPVLAAQSGAVRYGHNAAGFGDPYPILMLDHPYLGNPGIYYGHIKPTASQGAHVNAGQQLGMTLQVPGGNAAKSPGWLEIGFWGGNGPTGDGAAMKNALLGAAVGGMGLVELAKEISRPKGIPSGHPGNSTIYGGPTDTYVNIGPSMVEPTVTHPAMSPGSVFRPSLTGKQAFYAVTTGDYLGTLSGQPITFAGKLGNPSSFWLPQGIPIAPMAEGHVGQIAPGTGRLWAEPETGGEAYIPLSPNKRMRSTAILGQVAQQFGYGLHANANGGFYPPGPGMTGGRIASSQPIINHVYNQQRVSNATNYQFNGPIEGYSLEQVTKDAERKQRYAALQGSM